jgi:thioredoxin:protein disulfide reductase
MKPILVVIAVCLCCSVLIAEDAVLSIRTVAPEGPLAAGKHAVLTIELTITPPYHINSNHPLQDFLIPTTLQIQPQPGIVIGNPAFPPAPSKKLPFSDEPMSVYEGTVKILVEVTPEENPAVSEINLKGRLRYQACNTQYCLRPVSQDFGFLLKVGSGAKLLSQAPKAEIPPITRATPSGALTQPAAHTSIQADSGADFGNKSLLVIFLLVFLGGLALNLTPCVYPMIPITITYFGGQAQGKKGSLVAHSFLYVIGMAVTYSVLGVVAAMTGGLFGSAQQYPPVLIGIALVMVLLALSMFDVYEFRMPQFLNRLAGGSQKGFTGTFLMGLTVGIVAAPCIGPFVLGLLTYVGNKGNAVLGLALFFVLAIGMGVPFIVLGFFSGSIQRLPRSGAWMVWVRRIFGFILIAMAIYFLKPLFPRLTAYHWSLSILMLLAGVYLAWIAKVPGAGKLFVYLRNAIGVVFIAAAAYFAAAGFGFNSEKTGTGFETVAWVPYSDSMMDRARQESKPVFIDFYADWCAPCKELDKQTYATPEVVVLSKKFIMLKVDLTSSDDPQAEFLRKKYQARGVPTLVFLTPDGKEMTNLRGTGFEPKEAFLKKMEQALQISSGQKGRT